MVSPRRVPQAGAVTYTDQGPTPAATFGDRLRHLATLRRSSSGRAVAGVAAGLGRHFDIDPIIFRVLFVGLSLFGGAGVVLYAVLWLTVPPDDEPDSIVSGVLHRDPHAWLTVGLAIGAVLAGGLLIGSIGWAAPHPFPILIIAILLLLLFFGTTGRSERRTPAPPPSTPGPCPPASGSTPAGTDGSAPSEPAADTSRTPWTGWSGEHSESTTTEPAAPDSTSPAAATDTTQMWWSTATTAVSPVAPPPVGTGAAASCPPVRPQHQHRHLFALTMSVIAVAIAIVWAIDAATSIDVNPSVYPGVALALSALGLLVGAWWGRARGLIAVGIVAGLLTAGAAAAGPGPYGDRIAAPPTASAVNAAYDMGVGRFTLRLDGVEDPAALDGQTIRVTQRAGQLRIIVPSSVAAVIDMTVDHGHISGVRGYRDLDNGGEHAVLQPPADGRPRLTIIAHLDFGTITVERVACPGAAVNAPGESTLLWKWRGNAHAAPACN